MLCRWWHVTADTTAVAADTGSIDAVATCYCCCCWGCCHQSTLSLLLHALQERRDAASWSLAQYPVPETAPSPLPSPHPVIVPVQSPPSSEAALRRTTGATGASAGAAAGRSGDSKVMWTNGRFATNRCIHELFCQCVLSCWHRICECVLNLSVCPYP